VDSLARSHRLIVGGEFVMARCDPTTLFELVEEPLNQVAGAVEIVAEADRVVAIASRRDVWPGYSLVDELAPVAGSAFTSFLSLCCHR
jgi:hypothetical protein